MSKYIGALLIPLGLYLLLLPFDAFPSPSPNYLAFFLLSITSVLLIVGTLRENLIISKKVSINDKEIKVFHEISINGKKYYFIAFKVLGRETEEEDIDFYQELYNAIVTIYRDKSKRVNVAVLTPLDPVPSSTVVIYKDASDGDLEEFVRDAVYIKNTFEGVAPHLLLEVTDIKTEEFIPLPAIGDIPFGGFIGEKKYEVASAEEIVSGEFDIELGTDVRYGIPIGIRSQDIFRHMSIFGATGSGKSNTSTLIAKELRKRGFDVIIFDWHGEYHENLPEFNYYGKDSFIVLNPLASGGKSVGEIVDMIGDVLDLTDPQRYVLQLVVEQNFNNPDFDINKLPDILSKMDVDFSQKQVIIALVRKLRMLFEGIGSRLISSKNGISYKELAKKMKGGNIIDLSFISNLRLRRLYAMLLLKFLLEYYMEYRDRTRKVYIALEEAQNYLKQENMVVERALQEIRKFGVGLCIITQSPTTIDEEVLKNTNIKIVHAIKSNSDKRVVIDSMGLPSDMANMIDKLDVGQAILSAPNLRTFVVVNVKRAVS